MSTLIAEDLLLVLLDAETGKLAASDSIEALLGGALLTELALAEAVEVGGKEGLLRRRKVRTTLPEPDTTDPVLQHAVDVVREKERTAEDLVPRLGKKVRDQLLDRLEERGMVRREQSRMLGILPRTRWPAADRTHGDALRQSLHAALIGGATPDEPTAALVALLSAVDRAHKSVPLDGVRAGEVRRRAKAIAEGAWAAAAVREAVKASQAAVTAAVVAATAAGTASS